MQELLGDELQDELLPISSASPGSDSQLASRLTTPPSPEPGDEFLLDVGSESPSSTSAGDARSSREDRPSAYPIKLVFASRTHSQLAQVLREFARTAYAQRLTAVTLSSRLVRLLLLFSLLF